MPKNVSVFAIVSSSGRNMADTFYLLAVSTDIKGKKCLSVFSAGDCSVYMMLMSSIPALLLKSCKLLFTL